MSIFMASLFAALLLMLAAPIPKSSTSRRKGKASDKVLGNGTSINIYYGSGKHPTVSVGDDRTE